MKKVLNKAKLFLKNKWPQLLTIVAVFTLLFILLFNTHVIRFSYSIKSFIGSLDYYIKSFDFSNKELKPPVTSLDYLIEAHGGSILELLPVEFGQFIKNFPAMCMLFINGTFFNLYWGIVGQKLSVIMLIITIAINIAVLIKIIRIRSNKYQPNQTPKNTKALNNFLTLKQRIREKTKPLVKALKMYFSKELVISLIVAFAFYMQLFSIAIDLIGNYFYLLAQFHFDIIPVGLACLLIDFIPQWTSIPQIIRIIGIYFIFDLIRRSRADKRMEKCLKADSDFLDQCGNVILISGASRVGKNSLATTLSLIYGQYLLPKKLLGIMQDVERKFPFANYAALGDMIIEKSKDRKINNQLDIYLMFSKIKNTDYFYYLPNEKIETWDELTVEPLVDALRDWCLAFFFYATIQSPIAISNYSLVFNSKINQNPHYFNVDHLNLLKENREDYCRRIINKCVNFDYMRLGKRVSSYSQEKLYIPDVGLVALTEIGKERGSTDTIKVEGRNKENSRINKSNDKFNERLKIWSHIATIRYQTLFKLITDEQQDMEINYEYRRVCESILVLDRKRIKKKMALKTWFIEQLICKFILQKYDAYSLKRKENKQCITLSNYLLKKIINVVYLYFIRRINLYSYNEIKLFSKNGSTESVSGEINENTLYMINKISYSGRYDTTSLKRIFHEQMNGSKVQFDDLRSFSDKVPTDEDYLEMRSFLVDELLGLKRKEEKNDNNN